MRCFRALLAAALVLVATVAGVPRSRSLRRFRSSSSPWRARRRRPSTHRAGRAAPHHRRAGYRPARTLYGTADLLVVNGGTHAGVQLGQQYFVRRANPRSALDAAGDRLGVQTRAAGFASSPSTTRPRLRTIEHALRRRLPGRLSRAVRRAGRAGRRRSRRSAGRARLHVAGRVVAGNENRSAMAAPATSC